MLRWLLCNWGQRGSTRVLCRLLGFWSQAGAVEVAVDMGDVGGGGGGPVRLHLEGSFEVRKAKAILPWGEGRDGVVYY